MKNLKQSQVALSNFPYFRYSLDYALDSLVRMGAHNIEFYAAYPHFYLGDVNISDIKTTKKKLRNRNLHVIDVCPENCSYPVNVASTNINSRTRSIDHYIKAIQAANDWESPTCLFFPGWAHFDDSKQDAWKRGVEAMAYLCSIAESYGVQLLLETAPECSSIISSTQKQMDLIREVDSPALAPMVDFTCIKAIGEDLEEVFSTLGVERIPLIHFHNCEELTPGRWEHRIPERGVLNMEHLVEVLDENRFAGYFACEVFTPYEYEPEKAMLDFRNWFNALGLIQDT